MKIIIKRHSERWRASKGVTGSNMRGQRHTGRRGWKGACPLKNETQFHFERGEIGGAGALAAWASIAWSP